MQAINNALDRVDPNKIHSGTATTAPNLSAKQKLKLADAWQVLLSRRLVTDPVGSDAHLVFERDMADLSPMQIDMALLKSRDFTGWFSTPAFRELCHVKPEDLGLPEVHAAYIEAANADGMRDMQKWSHPAVFFAGRETGWFNLRNNTEKECFPLFKRNYEIICARVMAGETLDLPTQKALPSKVFVMADESHAGQVRARLREMLP
jgi:hypothetical protein